MFAAIGVNANVCLKWDKFRRVAVNLDPTIADKEVQMIQIPRAFSQNRKLNLLIATLLLASGPAALAGLSGGNERDVAIEVAKLPGSGRDGLVIGLDFSSDGRLLAVDSETADIEIWDWRHQRKVKSLPRVKGTNDVQTFEPIRFSADGRRFAFCHMPNSKDAIVEIWDPSNWAALGSITRGNPTEPGRCYGVAFSPDSRHLFVIDDNIRADDANLYVYDTGSFRQEWRLRLGKLYPHPESIAVSPDGETVAIGVNDMKSLNKDVYREWNIYLISTKTRQITRVINTSAMGAVGWSGDGKGVAVAGELSFAMYDADTGSKVTEDELNDTAHLKLRFTADGRYLILADSNALGSGTGIHIWDSKHINLLQVIHANIESLAISGNSRYMALGATGDVTVWQLK